MESVLHDRSFRVFVQAPSEPFEIVKIWLLTASIFFITQALTSFVLKRNS